MTPELPTGCIKDEPIDLYHSRDALSCSKLKVFRHSPALYHGRFVAKTIPPPDETRAFFLGKAIESLALDGRAAHEAAYYVVPEGVGKVRVGDKAIREQLAARNPGKIALPWDDAQIVERIKECNQKRRASQPINEKSAGCIFKNPPGHSAGKMIDELGLKGTRVGGAVISERHANFIVNRYQATAADIFRLMDLIRERVLKAYGVELEEEVIVWRK